MTKEFKAIIADMVTEYELLAKYNGGKDYLRWNALQVAAKELNDKGIPEYVIEDAIDKISHADIPDRYQDEYERAAYADGQGEAILILQECLKEAADGKG